jgi:PqqD family protein of HPr-rel-A system
VPYCSELPLAPDRPIPDSDVTAYQLDDELVLYDARTTAAHVLNASAARIWELCDGTRTLPELADALSATYALDPQRAQTDVSELVVSLSAAGLLSLV